MELIIAFAMLSYGLCFGFANKIPFLYSEGFRETGEAESLIDRLLSCTYCLGFHCGWLSAILMWCFFGFPALPWYSFVFGFAICGFASAAWCYVIDSAVRWFEGNA